MKKLYVFLILAGCQVNIGAQNDEGDTYTFESQTNRLGNTVISHNLKPALAERGGAARGTVFHVIYDNPADWNAGQKRAIEFAVKLWEEQLLTCYPGINLRVKFQNLGNPLARTVVRYYKGKNWYHGEDYVMSGALLKNWQIDAPEYLMNMGADSLAQYIENDDITITFNNEENLFYWGTDGNTPADKYDFVTLALREIAKGLEFCTTVIKRGNDLFQAYIDGNETNFDRMMGFNSYRYPSLSSQLANIVQNGVNRQISVNLYNPQETETLTFYCPNTFEPFVSFNYLTDESAAGCDLEFLKVSFPKGSSFHRIGRALNQLFLDKLGWGKPIPVGEVSAPSSSTSTDPVDYGQGKSFSFSDISASRSSLIKLPDTLFIRSLRYEETDYYSNYYYPQGLNFDGTVELGYRLDLLRNDGKYIAVKRSSVSDEPFIVKPSDIPDNENWARNSDGYLRARICFRDLYVPQGQPPYYYYYLFLDYVPQKPELSAVTKTSSLMKSYPSFPELMLYYKAWGATSVKLKHESEDGIVNYYFDPDEEVIDMSNADPYIENTFTLTAINKNGQKKSDAIKWGGESFMKAYYTFNRQLKSRVEGNHTLMLELQTRNGQGTLIEDPSVQGTIKDYRIIKADNLLVNGSGVANDCRVRIPIRQFGSGVYIVQATDKEGILYTGKFIIK